MGTAQARTGDKQRAIRRPHYRGPAKIPQSFMRQATDNAMFGDQVLCHRTFLYR